MTSAVDHLVVAARTLDEGVAWCEETLGVGQDLGESLAASRETATGRLAWKILVRSDGMLLCGGALPSLIQWQGRHPAQTLPTSGLMLQSLSLRGVPDAAREVLALPHVQLSSTGAPALSATLVGPKGPVLLESA
jgi:hypothetical protein